MSSPAFETFLAKIFTDDSFLQSFIKAPQESARAAGLNDDEIQSLASIDQAGLAFAARSFAKKRAGYAKCPRQKNYLWNSLINHLKKMTSVLFSHTQ
jgi:hypothetical protein